MKKKYLFLFLFTACLITQLSAQTFQWAKREGLYAYDYGFGVSTDQSGNVYVAGKYEMNANFSGIILPNQGNHDIYVAQYSPSGALNWIRTAGGLYGDYAHALACDGSNYVYIAGEIEGFGTPITFVGSSVTLKSTGSNDAFLAKYDLNGNILWAKSAGGFFNDKALGVTYDAFGNVFICGYFNDTAYFGGNTTIYGYGQNDIFVAKYDANGNFKWVRSSGGNGRDEANGVKCDEAGNVYVCGLYSNGALFGNKTLTCMGGGCNTFLSKYSTDGDLKWVKTGGSIYNDIAWGLTADKKGKIYMCGESRDRATFDGITLINSDSADVLVACYDTSGTINWAVRAGGIHDDRVRGITCDDNNLYITGQYGGQVAFDGFTLNAADNSDIFIACLNKKGNYQWIKSVGGPPDSSETVGFEAGTAICADRSGNVYTTGALLNGGVFGNTVLYPYSRTDMFLTRISLVTEVNEIAATDTKPLPYPNPGIGHFSVNLDQTMNNEIELRIYNCQGQTIDVSKRINSSRIEFDMSGYSKGIYFFELKTKNDLISRGKFVYQ